MVQLNYFEYLQLQRVNGDGFENQEDNEEIEDVEDVEDVDDIDDVVDIEDLEDGLAWQRLRRGGRGMGRQPDWMREVAALERGPAFITMLEGVRRFRVLAKMIHNVEGGHNDLVDRVGNCMWNVFQRLIGLHSKGLLQIALRRASEANVREILAIEERAHLIGNAMQLEDFIFEYWESLLREVDV
jgi:hypothetical protein